jgi:nitroreductase/Pyruvate/2-oxoacid:ferredoxin oxidoreductase delta subunit
MAVLEIDKETCTKCGLCAAICVGEFILFHEGKIPRPIPNIGQFCIRCGHCVSICPSDSIIHADIPFEECPPLEDSLRISFEQCAQLIKGRRSLRVFRDKAVPREVITDIIDVARYAPTGHNDQDVRWHVIDDKPTLQRIEEIGLDWMREVIARDSRMRELFERVLKRMEAGHPSFIRNAPALVIAHADRGHPMPAVDCALALGYFDLAANTAGLGCCWAGFFMMASNKFPALKELLALPGDQQVYGALMVGYPKFVRRRIPVRRPARITWR